ncbi:hypothetical protein BC829DRAFT_489560 [Chytridium lagenaria]|nr:hypothetical protein BC829DRAFT_489560 [Chytridium lagenaria]
MKKTLINFTKHHHLFWVQLLTVYRMSTTIPSTTLPPAVVTTVSSVPPEATPFTFTPLRVGYLFVLFGVIPILMMLVCFGRFFFIRRNRPSPLPQPDPTRSPRRPRRPSYSDDCTPMDILPVYEPPPPSFADGQPDARRQGDAASSGRRTPQNSNFLITMDPRMEPGTEMQSPPSNTAEIGSASTVLIASPTQEEAIWPNQDSASNPAEITLISLSNSRNVPIDDGHDPRF